MGRLGLFGLLAFSLAWGLRPRSRTTGRRSRTSCRTTAGVSRTAFTGHAIRYVRIVIAPSGCNGQRKRGNSGGLPHLPSIVTAYVTQPEARRTCAAAYEMYPQPREAAPHRNPAIDNRRKRIPRTPPPTEESR